MMYAPFSRTSPPAIAAALGQFPPTAEQTAKSRGQSTRRRARPGDEAGVIPILARAAREVESAVQKGPLKPASRTRFQVAALLLREEKERVKQDATLSEAELARLREKLQPVIATHTDSVGAETVQQVQAAIDAVRAAGK